MKKVWIYCFLLISYSCSKNNTGPASPFQGNWAGTYWNTYNPPANDTTPNPPVGKLGFSVAADGTISGYDTSLIYNKIFRLTGKVTDSINEVNFQVSAMENPGAYDQGTRSFTGMMCLQSSSGLWVVDSTSNLEFVGTWTATKR